MNIRILRTLLLILCALFALTPSVAAATITWTLQNVDFNLPGFNTGGLSGSFAYNAETGAYSSIDIVVTSTGTDITYPASLEGSNELIAVDGTGNLTGDIGIILSYDGFLTDSGGTIPVYFDAAGTCLDAGCRGLSASLGDGESTLGSLGDVTAAPEPGSLFLCGLGLIGAFTLAKGRARTVR